MWLRHDAALLLEVAYIPLSVCVVKVVSTCAAAQEIYTFADLQEKFSLDRITKSAAVFDKTKLAWMNGQHLRALPDEQARLPCTSWDSVGQMDGWFPYARKQATRRCHISSLP